MMNIYQMRRLLKKSKKTILSLMITSNLHTHSFYCGHGHGTPSEYVQKASSMGLKLLGMSEHLPFSNRFLSKSRMDKSEMPNYERDVKALKESADIDVLLGYEADYYPRYKGWIEEVHDRVDYLTFGVHFIRNKDGDLITPFSNELTVDDLTRYCGQFVDAVETDMFTFAAHPDLFYSGRPVWDENAISLSKDLISVALEHNLPLEINANGLIKRLKLKRPNYPFCEFWHLAEAMGATVIVGFDSHEVENLEIANDLVSQFVKENDLSFSQSYLDGGKIKFRKMDQQ